jgi:WD40 repeat protein
LTKDGIAVFSPDGTKLYVGNNDGWVRVYEVGTWRELIKEAWPAHSTEVTAMSVAEGGDVIVTAGGGNMILWSTNLSVDGSRRQRLSMKIDSKSLAWVQFCKSDHLIAHTTPDGPLAVWKTRPMEPLSGKKSKKVVLKKSAN